MVDIGLIIRIENLKDSFVIAVFNLVFPSNKASLDAKTCLQVYNSFVAITLFWNVGHVQ